MKPNVSKEMREFTEKSWRVKSFEGLEEFRVVFMIEIQYHSKHRPSSQLKTFHLSHTAVGLPLFNFHCIGILEIHLNLCNLFYPPKLSALLSIAVSLSYALGFLVLN